MKRTWIALLVLVFVFAEPSISAVIQVGPVSPSDLTLQLNQERTEIK